MGERGVDKTAMNTNTTIKRKIEEVGSTSSSEAFLACLFILVADNAWFKPPRFS